MKKLIITLLLFTSLTSKSQVYTAISFDPNVAIGRCALEKPGINFKSALGYSWHKLTVFKQFESYKDLGFVKWSANAEFKVLKYKHFESTINIGYGCIYRDFKEYSSYNFGGKILYNIGDFAPFIEYSIDERPDALDDTTIKSVFIGVSYKFNLPCHK